MDRDAKTYLLDISVNCGLILEFVNGIDLQAYKTDELIKSAVERRFIVIGEALTRLKQIDLAVLGNIPEAARIVAFRNILVHGYESVSDELVWEVIKDHVPVLQAKCEELLADKP